MKQQNIISKAKKIVIKIGTSVLTSGADKHSLGVNLERVQALAKQIVDLRQNGCDVIIVTSGAIGIGCQTLDLSKKPSTIPAKQAAAAIGQIQLMHIYENVFSVFKLKVAQLLLTQDVVDNRIQFLNARNTILTLLEYQVIPIINENDTVAVQEIRIGDNDNLAAIAANLIEADLVINLSTIDGLYRYLVKTKELLSEVPEITPEIKALVQKEQTSFGTGGMATKITAAEKITAAGGAMIIANGLQPDILKKIFAGENVGTIFYPINKRMSQKRCWIAFNKSSRGEISIDHGAAKALLEKGTSLLPIGVIAAKGKFEAGDMVKVMDSEQKEIARGLVNYSLAEVLKIKGKKTREISQILGEEKDYEEIIHRNNLVLTQRRGVC